MNVESSPRVVPVPFSSLPSRARIPAALSYLLERHMLFDGPPVIAAGSEFARDQVLEPREASNLRAWAYLATSLEHLRSAQILWNDGEVRGYGVSSMWTLLRTVLLSYVRTVWLISPDDAAVRVYRSCVLHEEDVQRQREPLEDLGRASGVLSLLDGDAAGQLASELADLDAVRVRLKARKRGLAVSDVVRQDSPVDTTKVVRVAKLIDGSEEGLIRTSILSSWRNASGHAHGLEWARLAKVEEVGRDGVVVHGRLKVDVEGLSMLAQSCALMGMMALDLFDARRTKVGSVFRPG
ncbi:hypothetical protein ACFQS2_12680 [Brachybacterium sp. GCM10030267]|uniref:hypothetical protein n=1 Tax=Brachybacterium sp. GCM10030267 TaxID=3273381 RepID=UPI00360D3F4A